MRGHAGSDQHIWWSWWSILRNLTQHNNSSVCGKEWLRFSFELSYALPHTKIQKKASMPTYWGCSGRWSTPGENKCQLSFCCPGSGKYHVKFHRGRSSFPQLWSLASWLFHGNPPLCSGVGEVLRSLEGTYMMITIYNLSWSCTIWSAHIVIMMITCDGTVWSCRSIEMGRYDDHSWWSHSMFIHCPISTYGSHV